MPWKEKLVFAILYRDNQVDYHPVWLYLRRLLKMVIYVLMLEVSGFAYKMWKEKEPWRSGNLGNFHKTNKKYNERVWIVDWQQNPENEYICPGWGIVQNSIYSSREMEWGLWVDNRGRNFAS